MCTFLCIGTDLERPSWVFASATLLNLKLLLCVRHPQKNDKKKLSDLKALLNVPGQSPTCKVCLTITMMEWSIFERKNIWKNFYKILKRRKLDFHAKHAFQTTVSTKKRNERNERNGKRGGRIFGTLEYYCYYVFVDLYLLICWVVRGCKMLGMRSLLAIEDGSKTLLCTYENWWQDLKATHIFLQPLDGLKNIRKCFVIANCLVIKLFI